MEKVNKIKIFNKEYILKFIDLPMTKKELIEQHNYIEFLRKNGILTPKIYLNNFLSLFKIELQEYLYESKEKFSFEKMISFLAKYHDVSYLYNKQYKKKKYYSVKQKCNDIILDKILINFKEKYYLIPVESVTRSDIKELYDFFYNEFILHYYNDDCIIHNDISINNIYFHNYDVCMIDFDFSTKGSIYVDFIDLVIKRTYDIKKISEYLIKNHILKKYIKIYNENSNNFHITYKGCLLMVGLKLLAYNYYVFSKSKLKAKFEKNVNELKELLELLKKEYYN